METRARNPIGTIAILFLVIVIDQMGITFIFPILTPLFMHPTINILPDGTTPEMRDFLYSFCLALYPFMMFLAAPLLGSLSDQLGRKTVLLMCLLGSAASFLLSAIAINVDSLSLLLISRAIAGFFSGSQYIAQAAIADISPPDKKAINLSYIIIAISVGMVFGPLIGGYLSDPDLATWLTYATPFEVAALLALINAILLWIVFSETFVSVRRAKLNLLEGFYLIGQAFIDKKIRLLSLILLFMILGWTLYFQSISWILLQRFNFNGDDIGLFIGYLGLGFAVTLIVVLRLLLKYIFSAIKIVLFALTINAIALLIAFLIPHAVTEWITGPFIIGSMAITYTILLALFSDSVSSDRQGWIMGVTGSIVAIAWTLAGLLAGPLGFYYILLPLIVSFALVVLALLCALIFARKHNRNFTA